MTAFIGIACLLACLDLIIWLCNPNLKDKYGDLFRFPFMSIVCYTIDKFKGKGKRK